MKEQMEFQTESKELLNLMINSIYSNKEIFLRELISNASDAIDKYKYLELTSNGEIKSKDYEIFIEPNKENRTLTIKDNGIGMSKEDLIKNLGTIAHSGSKEFAERIKEAKENKDLDIIGQFGVGFYSVFMIADEVEVHTKTLNDSGYVFKSNGQDGFSIEDEEIEDTGTRIVIKVKADTDDENYSRFLEEYSISDLVKRYSDFVRYPIRTEVTRSVPKIDENGKEIEGEKEDKKEIITLNSMVPLWKKNKKDVTDEEMNQFYKDNFYDFEDPLMSLNLNVEGVVSFNSLLFVPSHIPYDLYSQNYEKGLKLYVKGIFIKEKTKDLIPDYLKFVKGLVDTSDLSLNVSREILQEDARLKKIGETIENKVISNFKDVKLNDFAKYQKFYELYGEHLMYGIYTSYGYKKNLLGDLLIFKSLNSDSYVDLKHYKEDMKEGQKYIYYATGKTIESIKMLPEIEKFKKNGINVIFLTNNIDEFAVQMMRDYEKVEFKNISGSNEEDLSEEEKSKLDVLEAENKELLDNIKEHLGNKVDKVVLSNKLVDSPVCVTTKDGLSLNMEKTLNEIPGEEKANATKVLEINPDHAIFKAMNNVKADKEKLARYSDVLYDEAMLLEGFEIKDKENFIKNLNELIIDSLK
jgi:molecular chaperone HtpG